MAGSDDEIESELVDLNDVTLEQVRSLDESALGSALHRVLLESENPEETYAGFNNRI
jgi:FXSXX-COOH protein